MAANPDTISGMDDISFKKAVYRAILNEMGAAGLARYMSEQFATARNFTLERQQSKHELSLEEVLHELEKVDMDAVDGIVSDVHSTDVPHVGG